MHQAKTITSAETAPLQNANGDIFTRRGTLGAVLAAGAMIVATPIAAQSDATMVARDRQFWAAWQEWSELERAACLYCEDDGEVFERAWEIAQAALERAMIMPVTTATALLAKYSMVEDGQLILPEPARNSTRVLRRDIERLARQEMGQ